MDIELAQALKEIAYAKELLNRSNVRLAEEQLKNDDLQTQIEFLRDEMKRD